MKAIGTAGEAACAGRISRWRTSARAGRARITCVAARIAAHLE